jgi:LysM repeat protein
MKIIAGIVIAVVFYLGIVHADPLADQSQVTVIQVRSGDTVWKIAAEHSTERQDIREIVSVIRHLNQLDHNGQIQPGQLLKVPK